MSSGLVARTGPGAHTVALVPWIGITVLKMRFATSPALSPRPSELWGDEVVFRAGLDCLVENVFVILAGI